jgi:hypothetical protein
MASKGAIRYDDARTELRQFPLVSFRPLLVMSIISRVRCSLTMVGCTTLFLVAPVLGAQAPTAAEADGRAVMAVVKRLFDGMRSADSSVVRSVFDPRVRMITVSTRNGARATTLELGADNFAKSVGTPHPDVWDERIANPRVQIDGDLASVWVDYGFFAGPRFSHCGVDHFLLVRNDAGAWRILELADTRRTTGCAQWTTR